MSAPTKPPLPPDVLVAHLCKTTVGSSEGSVSKGFCGYTGGAGNDPLVTGFDDGYEFMDYLLGCGWKALPNKGDWPYLIYLAWNDPEGGVFAIAEYCEADLTVWRFETPERARTHYATLRDCP